MPHMAYVPILQRCHFTLVMGYVYKVCVMRRWQVSIPWEQGSKCVTHSDGKHSNLHASWKYNCCTMYSTFNTKSDSKSSEADNMVFLEAKHTAYIDPIMQVLLNRQTILCRDEKHYLCFPQYCMTNSLASNCINTSIYSSDRYIV